MWIKLNENSEFDVQQVNFNYHGRYYVGNGTLKWDPNDGFFLTADIEPDSNIGEFSFGGPSIISRTFIYLKIDKNHFGICPHVFIDTGVELELYLKNKIDISFPNLLIYTPVSYKKERGSHSGTCVFSIAKDTRLPDTIAESLKINDEIFSNRKSLSGLLVEDDKIKLRGYINNDGNLELSWTLKSNIYNLNDEWRLPKALRTALSICIGQSIEILSIELNQHHRTIMSYSKYRGPEVLHYFAPISSDIFSKELFSHIFYNQLEKKDYYVIVHKLFYRIVDTFKAKNFDLWVYMISTALEATLRTYDNKPFRQVKKEDNFDIVYSLRNLKQIYFSDNHIKKYRKIFKKVLEYYNKLRHRTVHPDWINESADSKVSYEMILFLVKFYGYLIKALVGYKDLEPKEIRL
ncbi:hypothetical protein J7K93_00935 [bacterium]|nr:hypothetical protein [bacterium]